MIRKTHDECSVGTWNGSLAVLINYDDYPTLLVFNPPNYMPDITERIYTTCRHSDIQEYNELTERAGVRVVWENAKAIEARVEFYWDHGGE